MILGGTLYLQGRLEEAHVSFDLAVSEARSAGALRHIARALRMRAVAKLETGDVQGSRADLDVALQAASDSGDTETIATVQGSLAQWHEYAGDTALAAALHDASVAGFRAVGSAHFLATELLNRAVCPHGDPEVRLAMVHEAKRLARAAGDRGTMAFALHTEGLVLRYLGDLQGALRANERALAIFRKNGRAMFVGACLSNLATLTEQMGRLAEALAYYEAALDIYRRLADPRGEAIVLGNLGDLHRSQGRYPEARAAFEEALELQRAAGRAAEIGRVQGWLGRLAEDQGDPDAARAHYSSAIDVVEGTEAADLLGYLYAHRARLDARRGHDGLAEAEVAEGWVRTQVQPRSVPRVLVVVAEARWWSGDVDGARALLAEAEALRYAEDEDLAQQIARVREQMR